MSQIEKVTTFTNTQYEIIREIGELLAKFGAQSDILSIVMSWGDTMSDETTLSYLKEFNQKAEVESKADYHFDAINA
jgi:hypothetical protein